MKKVFVDFHHAGLLRSLMLLFENRLGYEVFRPIGRDWFDKGFWRVYDHPATVAQFLDIGGANPDGTQPVNELAGPQPAPEVYLCQDIDSGLFNKAITFEGFIREDFDIVIATIPAHIEPFKRLIREHKPRAKFIFQIGNAWTVEAGAAPNVMASALISNIPPGINFVSYHQEFDTENVFTPDFRIPGNKTYSFMNCFSIDNMFRQDFETFQTVEQILTDWEFKCYGGQCRDGAMHGDKQVAAAMKEAKFIWHTKAGGDGYGHVLFNSAAVARPTIMRMEYYRGKLGAKLLKDGQTCVAIDGLTPEEIAIKVRHYSEPSRYFQMQKNVFQNFVQTVDFDADEKRIREFLRYLIPLDP